MTGERCVCGHPKKTHHGENTPITTGPCHATVYARIDHGPLTSGMNATRCKCRAFTPVSDQVIELVEAARAFRDMPPLLYVSEHFETDEISCSCGFVSNASGYEAARASLRRHIRRHTETALKNRDATIHRFDAALAALEASSSAVSSGAARQEQG